ncbi:MAG: carboxypeptidase regulatory-like domain-containing protein [Terriglobia bacterium]
MKLMRVGLFGLVVLLAAAPALWAQTQINTGVIQGTVVDESGAVMPDAEVTVKNLDTNLERSTSTLGDGRFVFLQLTPGRYTLTVSKQGFTTVIQENLTLTVGQTISLNLEMRVSPVAEQVIVTGTPTIDTVKTESSTTLNEASVQNTPVLGRKFEDLFTLTPGVAIVQGPDGDEISFSGQRGIFNNISLDGGDYQNGFFGEQSGGQRAQIDITLDAIKEFQVIATGASAEFGRTAGGVVNVITKSGTNDYHGSIFFFQRLEALSADDSQGNPLEDFHREQFGYTFGGPFVKERAFFFMALEQITANLERPNLSRQVGATACPLPTPTILTDEALINSNPDCERLALLNFMQTTRGQEEGNPVRRPIHNTAFLGKTDINVTPGNQLALTYSFDRSRNVNETFDVATYGSSANGIEGRSHIHTFNVNLFSTISSTMFNEGHFTYGRESRPRAAIPSNVPADTAMPVGGSGLPFFANPNAFRFGNPFFLNPTIDELFWRTQIKDNFSIIRGSHTIKFGGEWMHSNNAQVFRGFFTGRYIFDSVAGFLRYASPASLGPGFGPTTLGCDDGTFSDVTIGCGAANPTGGPLVLYLQGADRAGVATDAAGASEITNEDFAFFIQDKWQVRPNFTLNFGLRWEAQLMPDTVDPTTTAFGPFLSDTTTPTALGPGFPSDGDIPDQQDMVQPRIGFAWDLLSNSKSVLRAHWGIYNARQNMLTQVGSVTTNGLQQQTIFRDTPLIQLLLGFGLPLSEVAPTWPGVTQPAALPPGVFPDFSGVRVFSRNYNNPRIYTGNVAFEQELYPNWAFYVDVTISNGTRLPRFVDVNRADRGSPFGPALGETMVTTSIGQSTYRGVTFGTRKRYSQGFQLEWTYTYARDEDDDSNERDPFVDRSILPFNFGFDFGDSDRESRHRFNLFAFFDNIPGGIEFSPRIQARSATPITVDPTVGRNTGRKDNEFFSFDWRVSRPIYFGGERYAIIPTFEMFNTFDNDNNINPLIGPGLFNFDGFLRQGVGDPFQVQWAVKFEF